MNENFNTEPKPQDSQPEPVPGSPSVEQPVQEASEKKPVSQDARNMAMLCHLLGFFTNVFGPLILWLIKKDSDPYIDRQGKEALNFQITVLIASVVSGALTIICIGVFLAIAVGIADIIFSIMACVAASKGEDYRYPVSIRLIK